MFYLKKRFAVLSWYGTIECIIFAKPAEADALTIASKKQLEDNVNVDIAESKQRDF